MRNALRVLGPKNTKITYHLAELGMDGRIILKRTQMKYDVRVSDFS
jgi:hypothetical protein